MHPVDRATASFTWKGSSEARRKESRGNEGLDCLRVVLTFFTRLRVEDRTVVFSILYYISNIKLKCSTAVCDFSASCKCLRLNEQDLTGLFYFYNSTESLTSRQKYNFPSCGLNL